MGKLTRSDIAHQFQRKTFMNNKGTRVARWATYPHTLQKAALSGRCGPGVPPPFGATAGDWRLSGGWGERRPRRLLALGRETSKGNLEILALIIYSRGCCFWHLIIMAVAYAELFFHVLFYCKSGGVRYGVMEAKVLKAQRLVVITLVRSYLLRSKCAPHVYLNLN